MTEDTDTPEIDTTPHQDDGSHMDGFRAAQLEDVAPDDDVIAIDEEGNEIASPVDVEQITKDAFWVVFEKAFWFPGAFMPALAPLKIQEGHETTLAREASDAIYEILEIYWPGALLPQGDMLARVLVIVPFAMLKFATVREVLRAAKAPPPEQANAAGKFQSRRSNDEPTPANSAAPPSQGLDEVIDLSGGVLVDAEAGAE